MYIYPKYIPTLSIGSFLGPASIEQGMQLRIDTRNGQPSPNARLRVFFCFKRSFLVLPVKGLGLGFLSKFRWKFLEGSRE